MEILPFNEFVARESLHVTKEGIRMFCGWTPEAVVSANARRKEYVDWLEANQIEYQFSGFFTVIYFLRMDDAIMFKLAKG